MEQRLELAGVADNGDGEVSRGSLGLEEGVKEQSLSLSGYRLGSSVLSSSTYAAATNSRRPGVRLWLAALEAARKSSYGNTLTPDTP